MFQVPGCKLQVLSAPLLGGVRGWVARIVLLLSAFCILPSAFAQSNITATITVTNQYGITNGNSVTVSGSVFLVTNSTFSLRYIAPTNTARAAATNIANKLSLALTNQYFVSYGSSTSVLVKAYTAGAVPLSISTNWGILSFTTNGNIAGGIKASNVIGSSFTLGDITITNWNQVGGSGDTNSIIGYSTNLARQMDDATLASALAAVAAATNFMATNAVAGNILYVDAVRGADLSAALAAKVHLFAPDFPFLTLSNAQRAATNGDLIIVRPGIYPENNLGKNLVNWHLMNGAYISNWCSDYRSNSWLPIVKDFDGTTIQTWTGDGGFIWHNGDEFNNFTGTTNVGSFRPLTCGCTNTWTLDYAAITITNPASKVSIRLKSIECYGYAGLQQRSAAVNGMNGSLTLVCSQIKDRTYQGTNMMWIRPNGGTNFFIAGSTLCEWRDGTMYLIADEIGPTDNYAVWSIYPTYGINTSVTNNLWVTANHVMGRIYTSAESAIAGTNAGTYGHLWRNWYQFKWHEAENSAGQANLFCGFNYYTAQKSSTETQGGVLNVAASLNGGPTDTTVWVDVDKMSGGVGNLVGTAIFNQGAIIRGRVGQIDNRGTEPSIINEPKFDISGIIDIQGETAISTNGPIIFHKAGRTRLTGYAMTTTNTASPVAISTNSGLAIIGGKLTTTAGTNSITGFYASSSFSNAVELVGVVMNNAPATNITVWPNGGYTVANGGVSTNYFDNVAALSLSGNGSGVYGVTSTNSWDSQRLGGITSDTFPTNRQQTLRLGGAEWVVDTNTIQVFAAGTGVANGTYTNLFNGSYVNVANSGIYITNTGTAGGVPIWNMRATSQFRYIFTNSRPVFESIGTLTGTAPAPTNVFHALMIHRGLMVPTNGLVTPTLFAAQAAIPSFQGNFGAISNAFDFISSVTNGRTTVVSNNIVQVGAGAFGNIGGVVLTNGGASLTGPVVTTANSLTNILNGKTSLSNNIALLLANTNDFTLNQYYTNGNSAAWVSQCFDLTSTLTATARVNLYLDQDTDGTFERTGLRITLGGVVATDTQQLGAWIQPGGRFLFTNLTDVGATSATSANSGQWMNR